jgi:hypothetical protein
VPSAESVSPKRITSPHALVPATPLAPSPGTFPRPRGELR